MNKISKNILKDSNIRGVYLFPILWNRPALMNILELLCIFICRLFVIMIHKEKEVMLLSIEKDAHSNIKVLDRRRHCNYFLNYYVYPIFLFFKIHRNIDTILLVQNFNFPLFLIILGKILRKNFFVYIGGSPIQVISSTIPFSSLLKKIISSWLIIQMKIALYFADKIILISHRLSDDILFSRYRNKIFVAMNFPSRNFYATFKKEKKILDQELAIGYIGAFAVHKGFYNFLKSIPYVLSSNSSVKFIIAGNVQSFSPPALKYIFQQLLKAYPKNVVFYGYVPHKELPKYLNNIRLLVLPSYTEGIPHIILEAMSCGTPVLVTPVGEVMDVVSDNVTGFILQQKDPKFIASKVLQLLKDPNILEKISLNSHNFIKQNFHFKKTLNQWLEIFNLKS